MIFKDWRIVMASYADQSKAMDTSAGSGAPTAKRHRELMARSAAGDLFRGFDE